MQIIGVGEWTRKEARGKKSEISEVIKRMKASINIRDKKKDKK